MADWEDFKIFLELLNQLDLTALCYGSFSWREFGASMYSFLPLKVQLLIPPIPKPHISYDNHTNQKVSN